MLPALRHRAWRLPVPYRDVPLALAFIGVNLIEVVTPIEDGFVAGGAGVSAVVLSSLSTALAFRRLAPTAAWLAFHMGFLAANLLVPFSAPALGVAAPSAVLTYSAVRYGPATSSRWSWMSGPLLWTGIAAAHSLGPRVTAAAGSLAVMAALSTATGWVVRRMSDRAAALATAQQQLRQERHDREQAAAEAERTRIALEMNVGVTSMVEELVDKLANEAARLDNLGVDVSRLKSARESGVAALSELRRTLSRLTPSEESETRSLSELPLLVESFRDAGLHVALQCDPVALCALAPAVSTVGFRVLQEALTNALKHGSGAVSVSVLGSGDSIVLRVSNGLAAPTGQEHRARLPRGGHGLVGMRERVSAIGGWLEAGPDQQRGFTVAVGLPLCVTVAP